MSAQAQYTPGPASGAQVRKEGEKWTSFSPECCATRRNKVWQTLTGPEHLREWAPFDADRSLGAVAARVKLTTVGAPAPRVTETIVKRAEAPKALEYTWGDFNVRWQLQPLAGGTRLTPWTNIGQRFISMRWIGFSRDSPLDASSAPRP